MGLQQFGLFLQKQTNGKVKGEHILNAMMKKIYFHKGNEELGKSLVEDGIITDDEFKYYLKLFEEKIN